MLVQDGFIRKHCQVFKEQIIYISYDPINIFPQEYKNGQHTKFRKSTNANYNINRLKEEKNDSLFKNA